MAKTELLNYKIFKLNYENDVLNEQQIENEELKLNTSLETNVNCNEKEGTGICTYTLKMFSENENILFNVEIVLSGLFSYDKNEDRKEIHVEIAKKVFPYLQSKTSFLMAMIGIPDFILPEPELEPNDVKF